MSQTLLEPKVDGPGVGTGRWMVVIYDDDHIALQDVILALLAATGCSFKEAEIECWEAQEYGKAPVHFAGKEECDTAAAIISSIGVKTEVTPEWND